MVDYHKKMGKGSSWAARHQSLGAHYRRWGCTVSAEIGIARGELSYYFLKHAPSIEQYHAIDPFVGGYDNNDGFSRLLKKMNASEVWKSAILSNLGEFGCRFRLHHGFSFERYKDFSPESVDCLFIDGDHTFKGVKTDIQLWAPIVKPGGYFIFDDVNNRSFPGVVQAMTSFCERNQLVSHKLNEHHNYYIQKPINISKAFDFDW